MYGPLVFVRLSRRLVFLHGVRVIEVKLLPVLHPLVLPAILCERLQQFGGEESFIVAKDLCVNVPVSYEALVFVLKNAHYAVMNAHSFIWLATVPIPHHK